MQDIVRDRSDFITLENFKIFVANQVGTYEYDNPRKCAFAQFLKALGYSHPAVSTCGYVEDYLKTPLKHFDHAFAEALEISFGRWDQLLINLEKVKKLHVLVRKSWHEK